MVLWDKSVRQVIGVLIVSAFYLVSTITPASARDLIVGKGEAYSTLWAAVADARSQEIILIKQGTYDVRDLEIPMDLTIIGIGEVTLTSRRPVAKGLLVPVRGADLILRNLTFTGARSPDKNGAGIRFEGRSLRLSNCTFKDNDDGILATGSPDTKISISDSKFINNGYGDGYSHGIYINRAVYLSVENSEFRGTRVGHHIKSMATQETIIRNNKLIDDDGETSYMVDVTAGGNVVIEGNEMIRSQNASQDNIFNYDTSRGGEVGTVIIRNNKISSYKKKINLLRNPLRVNVDLSSNDVRMLKSEPMRVMQSPDLMPQSRTADPVDVSSVTPEKAYEGDKKPIGQGYTEDQLASLTPTQRRAVQRLEAQRTTVMPEEKKAAGGTSLSLRFTPTRRKSGQSVADVVQSSSMAQPPAVARKGVTNEAAASENVPRPQLKPTKSVQTRPIESVRRDTLKTAIIPHAAGLVTLPDYSPADIPGHVASFNLLPRGGRQSANTIVTFGQVFPKGRVRENTRLSAQFDEAFYPAQMDAKAFHKDGSVRHAVVTVSAPISSTPLKGALVKVNKGKSGVSALPDTYQMAVHLRGQHSNGAPFDRKLMLRDITDRTVWQQGPLAYTITVREEVTPLLTIVADIQVTGGKYIRTRLSFENHKTFYEGARDISYQVQVSDGARAIFMRNIDKHYRGSNWSEVLWKGSPPLYEVQLDPHLMIESSAVPAFDLAAGITPGSLAQITTDLARTSDAVFANKLLTQYFPSTGGRPEIGMLPAWDIMALKTQNMQALKNHRTMAAVSGAVPWHFEDDATGLPVRIDQRTSFWADERGVRARIAKDRLPQAYFKGSAGGFTLDLSHKPALSYFAYLTTAEPYYMRELTHEAAYAISGVYPEVRAQGLIAVDNVELRASAWSLRDIGNAAWVLPDAHPMKIYFTTARQQNLAYLKRKYIDQDAMKIAGAVKGYFEEHVGSDPNRVSPWQNDYMLIAVAQEALRGSKDAVSVVKWTKPYQLGRFIAPGADPKLGPIGVHVVRDTAAGRTYTSWMEVMAASRANGVDVYANDGTGYMASAAAALASYYNVTGDPEAAQAMQVMLQSFPESRLWDVGNKTSFYDLPGWLFSVKGFRGTMTDIRSLGRLP